MHNVISALVITFFCFYQMEARRPYALVITNYTYPFDIYFQFPMISNNV